MEVGGTSTALPSLLSVHPSTHPSCWSWHVSCQLQSSPPQARLYSRDRNPLLWHSSSYSLSPLPEPPLTHPRLPTTCVHSPTQEACLYPASLVSTQAESDAAFVLVQLKLQGGAVRLGWTVHCFPGKTCYKFIYLHVLLKGTNCSRGAQSRTVGHSAVL